jgi:hypothetical protein
VRAIPTLLGPKNCVKIKETEYLPINFRQKSLIVLSSRKENIMNKMWQSNLYAEKLLECNTRKSGNIRRQWPTDKWHCHPILQYYCGWLTIGIISTSNVNFAHHMSLNFVTMHTRPANLVDESAGQTDCPGQLDAFDETEHIHPDFNSDEYNFTV